MIINKEDIKELPIDHPITIYADSIYDGVVGINNTIKCHPEEKNVGGCFIKFQNTYSIPDNILKVEAAYHAAIDRKYKWERVKNLRKQTEEGGIMTVYGPVNSTFDEVQRMQLAYGTVDWTMKDNSIVSLTWENRDAIIKEVREHYSVIHSIAQDMRKQIEVCNEDYDVDTEWDKACKTEGLSCFKAN